MYKLGYVFDKNTNKLQLKVKEKNRIDIIDSDLRPYFYLNDYDLKTYLRWAKSKEKDIIFNTVETSKKSLDGNEVVKLEFQNPQEVGNFRRYLEYKWNFRTYEGDIPYVRRYMIDKQLKVDEDYNVLYLDIERETLRYGKILCIGWEDSNGKKGWIQHDEEDIILDDFLDLLIKRQMIAGWNVNYDIEVIKERLKYNNMKGYEQLDMMNIIDLLDWYDSAWNDTDIIVKNAKLETVAKAEFGIEKSRYRKDFSIEELEKYNTKDVEIVRMIDDKYKFTKLAIEIARTGFVFPEEVRSVLKVIDSMVLDYANRNKKVLPSVVATEEQGEVQGAFIKINIEPGVYENVAVFDYNSLYPNIIINENVDDIMKKIVQSFLEKRQYYKEKYKETKDELYNLRQWVYKILSNATYGVMFQKYFRLYDIEKSNKVTQIARIMLWKLNNKVEELGLKVMYNDTDSAFIQVKDINKTKIIENILNKYLSPYRIKFEGYFRKILFPRGVSEKEVKKRYIGYFNKEDKETLKIVGLEAIRTDSTELESEFQIKVAEMILNGDSLEKIQSYINNIVKSLEKGIYDKKIIFNKGISKRLKDYDKSYPHIKVAQQIIDKFRIKENDIIKVEYWKGKKGWIPYWNEEKIGFDDIDYRYYKNRLEQIWDRLNIKNQVINFNLQKSLF